MNEAYLRDMLKAHGWTLVRFQRQTQDGARIVWQARQAQQGDGAAHSRTVSVYLCRDADLPHLTADEVRRKLAGRGKATDDLVLKQLPEGAVRLQRGAKGHGVTLTAAEVGQVREWLGEL